MISRTITAVYDSAADAQRAEEQLFSLGLPKSDVRVVNQGDDLEQGDGRGFWESIKEFFVADDERATYVESVRRGGYLLTARVDEEYVDQACDILETSDAVDLDQRAEEWRSKGWSELAPGEATATSGQEDSAAGDQGEMEEALPIVREQLRVGKREVNRGGVRVRSYIVEEPVSEQVELREEHVEVERRPAGQQNVQGDAGDLLQERTIEVSENAEEALIAKDANVTEEVVVRKFEDNRTEDVSDTARHTEVDVEDTRDDAASAPPPNRQKRTRGPTTSKPAR